MPLTPVEVKELKLAIELLIHNKTKLVEAEINYLKCNEILADTINKMESRNAQSK